jgi:hypothetical protein
MPKRPQNGEKLDTGRQAIEELEANANVHWELSSVFLIIEYPAQKH